MARRIGYLRRNQIRHEALDARIRELESQGILRPATPFPPEEVLAEPASAPLGKLDFTGCLPSGCDAIAVHMLTIYDFFAHIVTIPIGPDNYLPIVRIEATEALTGFGAHMKVLGPPRRRSEKGWQVLGVFDFIGPLHENHPFIEIRTEGEFGMGVTAAGVGFYAPGDEGPIVYLPVFRIACRGQVDKLESPPR